MLDKLPSLVEAFKPYAGKLVTIPMSSGVDSTLLAISAIEAGCNVKLLRLMAFTPTSWYEKSVAKEIDEELRIMARDRDLHIRTVYKDVPFKESPGAMLSQMSWWLAILPLAMETGSPVVAMGWLASDGTMTLAADFRQAIMSTRKAAYEDVADVIFPLLHYTKDQALMALAKYPAFAKLVWWCENGSTWELECERIAKEAFAYEDFGQHHEQCGRCHSCTDTLGYFTRWNGDFNGNVAFRPMNHPPSYLLDHYVPISVSAYLGIVKQAIEAVAKHYNRPYLEPDIGQMKFICNTPPYTVKAEHAVYHVANRNVRRVELDDALMQRRYKPTDYQRAIEHLSLYALRHLEMDKLKQPAKRLKEISLVLQSMTDTLWPVPAWFVPGEAKPKEQEKIDETIHVQPVPVSAAN